MRSSHFLSSRICLLAAFLFTALASSLPETLFESHDLNARRLGFKKRNLETITKIYNTTVYPNNLAFIARGPASVPPGLFNENATGRITPLGNFTGFNDSTEYFFALAPVPQPPSYSVFSKAQIVSFQSECAQFAASVVYFTQSVLNPNATNNGQFVGNLKQVCPLPFPFLQSQPCNHHPHTDLNGRRLPSGNSTPKAQSSSTTPGSRISPSTRQSLNKPGISPPPSSKLRISRACAVRYRTNARAAIRSIPAPQIASRCFLRRHLGIGTRSGRIVLFVGICMFCLRGSIQKYVPCLLLFLILRILHKRIWTETLMGIFFPGTLPPRRPHRRR